MPIYIAIADDQTMFREGLKLIFDMDPRYETLIEAQNGQDLIDQLHKLSLIARQVDIILLDYSMPVMDGYEAMKCIQLEYPGIKFLILSMHYDEHLMVHFMQQGANGYLLKDESSKVLTDAIQTIIDTGYFYPSYVSTAMLNQIKASQKTKKVRLSIQKEQRFSQRELEVLQLIGTCNRKEMAEKLFVSVKTIDFHLKNLKDKTSSQSTPELVNFALKNGFQD